METAFLMVLRQREKFSTEREQRLGLVVGESLGTEILKMLGTRTPLFAHGILQHRGRFRRT